jgi:3-oxoadipate enol-lactonase/4-carboxymuconolactone decarboxylase
VRYEHPGHGGAPSRPDAFTLGDLGADVVELLDHLGAEQAALAGISLGGMVSLWVAVRHPERVTSLVAACTGAHLPPAESWYERAALVRAEGTSGLVDTLLGRWFTAGFADRDPTTTAAVRAMLATADPGSYAACCDAIAATDLRSELGRVTAPTLVLVGADDPVTPPEMALGLQRAIAGAGLVVLPRAAHLANLEQPATFTEAVVDHLLGPMAERGRRARRAVLGDAHVDRSDANASAFNAAYLDLIGRYAWGEIWNRPGLDRRTRSCLTLAMLTALGRFDELPLHVRGALRNGVSEAEIAEVLLQSAIYCGVPAANSAFAVAKRVLEEERG